MSYRNSILKVPGSANLLIVIHRTILVSNGDKSCETPGDGTVYGRPRSSGARWI